MVILSALLVAFIFSWVLQDLTSCGFKQKGMANAHPPNLILENRTRGSRRDYREVLGLRSKSKNSQNMGDSEGIALSVDPAAERELFSDEELNNARDSEESLEFLEDVAEDLSTEQILAMAEEEESRCKDLETRQRRLEEERKAQEEETRRQQQQRAEAIQRLKALRSKRAGLERSFQESASTPKVQAASASRSRPAVRPKDIEHKAPPPRRPVDAIPQERGECSKNLINIEQPVADQYALELLASIKDLQKGQPGQFFNIVTQAMSKSKTRQATDGQSSVLRKAGSLPNVSFDSVVKQELNQLQGQVIGSCVVDTQSDSDKLNIDNVVTGGSGAKSKNKKVKEEGQLTDSDESPERGKKPKSKLKSGILTNPDETGITKVVRYPHTKLDPVHVKDRSFNNLPFHFLVAGELELILDQKLINSQEREARLHFLRIMSYHKQYLDIEDIRAQYVATLQVIEKGDATWTEYKRLADQLHTNLTFRATVKSRERENETVARLEKLVDNKDSKKGTKGEPVSTKTIYCSEYNKGSCAFDTHHEGVFNKRTVKKWHVCRKCLLSAGHPKKFHPESECTQKD